MQIKHLWNLDIWKVTLHDLDKLGVAYNGVTILHQVFRHVFVQQFEIEIARQVDCHTIWHYVPNMME